MIPAIESGTVFPDVLIGALGNLVGGLLATALWFLVTHALEAQRTRAFRLRSCRAAKMEIAKLLAALGLLRREGQRGLSLAPMQGGGALTAIIRLSPPLSLNKDWEHLVAEVEHQVRVVDAIATRLFFMTIGVAAAMNDTSDEQATELARLADAIGRAETAISLLSDAITES